LDGYDLKGRFVGHGPFLSRVALWLA